MKRILALGLAAAAASILAPAAQAGTEVCLPIVRYTQVHEICYSVER